MAPELGISARAVQDRPVVYLVGLVAFEVEPYPERVATSTGLGGHLTSVELDRRVPRARHEAVIGPRALVGKPAAGCPAVGWPEGDGPEQRDRLARGRPSAGRPDGEHAPRDQPDHGENACEHSLHHALPVDPRQSYPFERRRAARATHERLLWPLIPGWGVGPDARWQRIRWVYASPAGYWAGDVAGERQ